MSLYYQDENVVLHHGDCIEVMRSMPAESVDSIVTDPPYGLGFMGKKWDALPPGEEWARECLRVLKPGGHLLAFGGSRTWHRLAVAIEDAGFEIRDGVLWLYGSGFPKSHDISKAIDKADDTRHKEALTVTVPMAESMRSKGLSRRDLNLATGRGDNGGGSAQSWTTIVADGAHKPRVPTLEQWDILRDLLDLHHLDAHVWRLNGRKGQPGENWEQREVTGEGTSGKTYGMGGLRGVETSDGRFDITTPATDAARKWEGWGTALKPAYEPAVMARKPFTGTVARNVLEHGTGALNIDASRIAGEGSLVRPAVQRDDNAVLGRGLGAGVQSEPSGRWPANVILDERTAELLDEQSGVTKSAKTPKSDYRGAGNSHIFASESLGRHDPENSYTDSGGASRFFYVAKAPKSERPVVDGVAHATVKPLKLMRYLVRMVTPPGGTILEPFAGSGTTIEAALIEGFNVIGIEREIEYLPLIQHRINRANGGKP